MHSLDKKRLCGAGEETRASRVLEAPECAVFGEPYSASHGQLRESIGLANDTHTHAVISTRAWRDSHAPDPRLQLRSCLGPLPVRHRPGLPRHACAGSPPFLYKNMQGTCAVNDVAGGAAHPATYDQSSGIPTRPFPPAPTHVWSAWVSIVLSNHLVVGGRGVQARMHTRLTPDSSSTAFSAFLPMRHRPTLHVTRAQVLPLFYTQTSREPAQWDDVACRAAQL